MTELRPYQTEVIAEFDRTVAAGVKRIILVAPTGSGKTLIAGAIIKAAVAAWRTVLVLSHRREITAQTSRKLYDLGIRHGIIQAGFSPRPLERVQVASVQTLSQRAIRTDTASNLCDLLPRPEHWPPGSGSFCQKSRPRLYLMRDYSRRFAFTATLLVGSAKNRTA
jgi:superfamily II DNA or RNA helicase